MNDILNEGDMAPDFALPRDGGTDVTLSGMRGGGIVLFFYPRDDTAGCTTEAQDFSRLEGAFAALRTRVLGISKDPVAAHEKFREKRGLTVALMSDESSDVCERYGVWVEKKMYGRTFMGIERATFLIDPEGRIAGIWRPVKVPGHADAVLAAARQMGEGRSP